jgi:hypothetical protein
MEDKMRNTREAAAARTLAADMALANGAVLAELRGLRCDVRELIGVLRANRALDPARVSRSRRACRPS